MTKAASKKDISVIMVRHFLLISGRMAQFAPPPSNTIKVNISTNYNCLFMIPFVICRDLKSYKCTKFSKYIFEGKIHCNITII